MSRKRAMGARLAVRISLICLGIALAVCFGYGGYLRRERPISPHRLVSPASQTADELLSTAKLALQKKKVEQALIAYRRVLTLAPESVAAQIGVAQAELMAGREDVSA